MESLNFNKQITEIKKMIKSWCRRNLTVLGRITILKSLIISKLTYLLLCLPNPPETFINTLNTIFFEFIWQSNTDRVKRDIMIQNYENGGVKMTNVFLFMKSLKVSWIRRLSVTNSKWYKLLMHTCNFKLENLFKLGSEYIKKLTEIIKNNFWRDVFNAFYDYCNYFSPKSANDILSTEIWYNKDIKVKNHTIFYNIYYKNGIRIIADLFNTEGVLYNYESFLKRFNINTNFLEFNGLIASIKSYLRNYQFNNHNTQTNIHFVIFLNI